MVSSKSKSDVPKNAAAGRKFAIVVSRYHEQITRELLKGAEQTLESYGASAADISTTWAPGSFELPLLAQTIAQYRPETDAILCLGVIVKGETPHNEYIAHEVAHGIAQVGRQSGIPTIFGVLTPDTLEQASARVGGGKGHKGEEAAEAAVAMVHAIAELKGNRKKTPGGVGFNQ